MSRSFRHPAARFTPLKALSRALAFGLMILLVAGLASGVQKSDRVGIAERSLRHADLDIETVYRLPSELQKGVGTSMAAEDLSALGLAANHGRLDARSGRWAALTPSTPLVPGSGVGNTLTWEGMGLQAPTTQAAYRAAVDQAFRNYLQTNAVQLRIDVSELAASPHHLARERLRLSDLHPPGFPRNPGSRQLSVGRDQPR